MMMEWVVWLADGSIWNSHEHTWEEIPDGVLVVRVWNSPRGKLLMWGDAYYGRPDTLKMEAMVSDEQFYTTLEIARGCNNPPSKW